MKNDIFQCREENVKHAITCFFGSGTLDQKLDEAQKLSEMNGIEIFMTPVPWYVRALNIKISGFSETMLAASADIASHLHYLKGRGISSEQITIEFDEQRFNDIVKMQGWERRNG